MPPKRVQVEKAYDEPFILVPNADVLELMQRVKPTSVCVYLALMTHANRKAGNSCYPSTGTIAREANVSRRTVVSAVQELEEAGALVVEHRVDPEFGQTSSMYWLHRMRCADFAQGCEESEPPGGTKLAQAPAQDLHTNHMNQEPDEEEPENNPHEGSFIRFWDVWPKKVDKEDAHTVWMRMKPSPQLVETIIAAVEAQTANNWIDTPKNFIPGPARWLRGKKWNDEIIEPQPKNVTPFKNSNRNGKAGWSHQDFADYAKELERQGR